MSEDDGARGGVSPSVVGIYVAPHAGGPMVSVPAALAVPERGLKGDRYFDGVGTFSRWPGPGRAVSLIEQESIDAIARECGLNLGDGRSRRNLVTSGVPLAELIGRTFRIGGAVLRGSRACTECRYLERLVGPGIFVALRGRGGLRADVVREGVMSVGDEIVISEMQPRKREGREGSREGKDG